MNSNNNNVRVIKYSIAGWVQGVGMRYWVQTNARKLNLNGWVRNEIDQTVSALFIGETSIINDIPNWLQEGPRLAKITNINEVEVTDNDLSNIKGFNII